MQSVRSRNFLSRGKLCPRAALWGIANAMLLMAASARAVIVPLPNSQGETLTGSVGITGASASIKGSFFFVDFPAQTVPVSLSTPLKLNSEPDPSSAFVAELVNNSLVNFTNFDIDLLNGSQVDFVANPLLVDELFFGHPAKTFIDFAGSLSGMSFTQTGAPTVFPMPVAGIRDFSVPGTMSLDFGKLVFGFGDFDIDVGPMTAELPITLSGTFSRGGAEFFISGTGSADVPLAVLETIPVGEPASNFTAGIQGTAHVQFDYAFSVYNVIPEPASVVLLGIGITALAIVAFHSRK